MRHRAPRPRRILVTRLSALGATLVLGASVIVVATGGAPAASAATPPACTASNLVVWLNTEGSGAAGSSYYDLNFTNVGARACTLEGYPGVSGVSKTHAQLGSAAGRSTTRSPALITLGAGGWNKNAGNQSATAIVQITVAGNFPTSTCHQVVATALRVYAPGQRSSKLVPYPFDACAKRGPVYLHVEPLGRYQSQQ